MMMARLPTVGVAMSVYNQEALVAASIESLLEQTKPPDQIVVADDGSTDGSIDVVERYASEGVELLRLDRCGVAEVLNSAAAALDTDMHQLS